MKMFAFPALLAVLVLTGCTAGGAAEAGPTPTATIPDVTPVPTPTPDAGGLNSNGARSERGSLIKTVGQQFGVGNDPANPEANFVVTAITVDPACTGPNAKAPENGHFVKLDITGETGSSQTRV